MTELVLRPLADAFMQVGVFVAVLVAAFGWARLRHGERLTTWLLRHTAYGPVVGAMLGVSPGCGGAIVLVPLLLRGAVSYGTVVAALVATMGDSSWVLIAANPVLALQVHLLLFVVGVLTGYAVDASGWRPRLPDPTTALEEPALNRRASFPSRAASPDVRVARLQPAGAATFWSLATPGFLLAVPVVVAQADAAPLTRALGGVDPYLALGVGGTLAALLIVVTGRSRGSCCSVHDMAGLLRQSAYEASFVTVCVAGAYLAWSLLVAATGFDASALALAGLTGVLVGAFVGLIPGCALQIVFTGLFVSGALPLPTLLANAVSQDGDALFPMLAVAPRAAVVTSAVTVAPALLVGALALVLL